MKTKFFLFLLLVAATQMKANNMLVKNVTTTGNNATNKTIQVQFDMSWDNSWRDGINWDAAWVFMKYKDANGLWQHVQLNTTGFANGTGTANTIQVGSDKVGAFVYRSATGTGTFSSTTMQLQWNYGLSGLTNVTGLEIRVFAVEMVYVPQGDFTIHPSIPRVIYYFNFYYPWRSDGMSVNLLAPGNNTPIINNRLSPTLNFYEVNLFGENPPTNSLVVRIKGDAGIDTDNNGTVDITTYPIGYNAFYCYKYNLTEQQYADFLNTLTANQKTGVGVAGNSIFLTNGEYFSSAPTTACANSSSNMLLAYADWSGIRPITVLEFNKISNGPLMPNTNNPSYYGIWDLSGYPFEPCVSLINYAFTKSNGNGVLGSTGATDMTHWTGLAIDYLGFENNFFQSNPLGFRYVRSAE
jgi:hypothetical protein